MSFDLFARPALLFLPASNPRAIEKARESGADAVILDLEDAVRAEDKASARAAAMTALAEDWPMPVAIRINGVGTEHHGADLSAVVGKAGLTVVVPSVRTVAELHGVAAVISRPPVVMIETAPAVVEVIALARQSAGLILGTNDLAADLRLPPGAGRQSMQHAIQSTVLAARAVGVPVFDGVYNRLDDPDGFAREAAESRALGFDGKSLIHPSQIAPCQAAFAPSADELARAERLIAAASGGAQRFEGAMIEDLHVEAARRLLGGPMNKLIPILAALLAGCATVSPDRQSAITDSDIRATMAALSSDSFEGRMAGTPGEAKTIAYLAERFRDAGLSSGARGPVPFLDPFAIVARPARPPVVNGGLPSAQAEFTAHIERLGKLTSHNVIGVVRGRHPDGKAVLLMAHWDHLGVCAPQAVDKICNGAVDNASGVAAIVAVAGKVAHMGLDRDVWFVVTGAEEWGLLGAKAFADKPPLPLASIIAGFNLDTIAIAPAGSKVAMVAPPHARLEPLIIEAAKAMGRGWDGDHEADNFLRRQDGWVLAERGVPMVMAGGSFSDLGLLNAFLHSNYHQPSDELRATTDLGGAVDDANLHVELVRLAANRHFSAR